MNKENLEKRIAEIWIEMRCTNNCPFMSFHDYMDSIRLNCQEILLNGDSSSESDSTTDEDVDLYDMLENQDISVEDIK